MILSLARLTSRGLSLSRTAVCHLHTPAVSTMPQPPFAYRSADSPVLDLGGLGSKISESDQNRSKAFDVSRELLTSMVKAKNTMEFESSQGKAADALPSLEASLREAIGNTADRKPRLANLSNRVEEFVRLMAFHHFLATGQLLPPSTCAEFATDEEYLAGACMGLCQDLSRYGLGRATARDFESVSAARNLVQEILSYLMQFDFRNGYLRRKYDGTKYSLKTLETLLYELSVTGCTGSEGQSSGTPQEELDGIRTRMVHRDEQREKLIKKCRDGQKAAKQAIYALHRRDQERASKLLKQCEECIQNELLPIVNEEPPLRSGSFANVLEEYVEARLFFVWLLGKEGTPSESASGVILKPGDFDLQLEPEEYLGGLCDLTGEIGRYAVQRGTSRDFEGVRRCLEANSAILFSLQTIDRYPGSIGKKMEQLRRSVEKLERMTYEMSLSEAAGGRKVDSEEIVNVEDSFKD